MEIITAKRCTKCGECKPMCGFYTDGATLDGYKHACKDCINARSKASYARRKASGKVRRRNVKREVFSPVPHHTIQEGLANVTFRKAMCAMPAERAMWGAM